MSISTIEQTPPFPNLGCLQEKTKKLFDAIDKRRTGVASYNDLFQVVYKDEAAAQVRVTRTASSRRCTDSELPS